MKTALFAILCVALAACASPLNTRGVSADLAGRCKLMAYKEDRGVLALGYLGASGLAAMAITQANGDARRQEIFDACVEAGGTREQPPEMPN